MPPNFNELPQPSDNNLENNSNKDNENEFKNIMKKMRTIFQKMTQQPLVI